MCFVVVGCLLFVDYWMLVGGCRVLYIVCCLVVLCVLCCLWLIVAFRKRVCRLLCVLCLMLVVGWRF